MLIGVLITRAMGDSFSLFSSLDGTTVDNLSTNSPTAAAEGRQLDSRRECL